MTDLTELHTIRDMLRWAISRFNESGLYYGHGTDSSWDEALTLILRGLHLPHDINPELLKSNITAAEREHLQKLIERRIHDRIPVPYLIHEAWFAGMPFYVDERVLVPRSPIAELIEHEFQPWLDIGKVETILDLCTGSGCIAIACAKTFPSIQVDASDISTDALAVAKMNVLRYDIADQVQLFESDLFTELPPKKYDLIICNPPYVDAADMAALPLEYHHEPRLGLAAGNDGLDIVKRILATAQSYLSPTGTIIVEVGNSETALAENYPDVPFTWLEFQRGGGGVFLLTAQQLAAWQKLFTQETYVR
ncbi:MAG: 50S ribosomal protein L3 N(5)-glutamine methyltransferase [Pseudomonadota bacterium]